MEHFHIFNRQKAKHSPFYLLLLVITLNVCTASATNEDGHRLWLRYDDKNQADVRYKGKTSQTIAIAVNELKKGWNGTSVILSLSGKDKIGSFRISSNKN